MNNPSNFIAETVNDVFILIIRLKRATIEEAGELNKALSNAIETGWEKLLIDMKEVEYIDSTFLGALVINLKKITGIKGKFGLISFKGSLHTFIQQMSLDRTFDIYESREEALKKISS